MKYAIIMHISWGKLNFFGNFECFLMLQMNQQCKVCGEPAAGFHFGAFTCEGCKVNIAKNFVNSSIILITRNAKEILLLPALKSLGKDLTIDFYGNHYFNSKFHKYLDTFKLKSFKLHVNIVTCFFQYVA